MISPESNQTRETTPFYCNLSALDAEQRERHKLLSKDLVLKHLEIRELPDGYELRFPSNSLLFKELSEWATLEQLCCPFLTLTLELQHDQGPIWLRATGRDRVKDFLRAEIRDLAVQQAP